MMPLNDSVHFFRQGDYDHEGTLLMIMLDRLWPLHSASYELPNIREYLYQIVVDGNTPLPPKLSHHDLRDPNAL